MLRYKYLQFLENLTELKPEKKYHIILPDMIMNMRSAQDAE